VEDGLIMVHSSHAQIVRWIISKHIHILLLIGGVFRPIVGVFTRDEATDDMPSDVLSSGSPFVDGSWPLVDK